MRALILVDIQRDFLPGGALAVPEGEAVVPVANRIQPVFDLVVATQDWHPADHGSFASNHPGRRPGETVKRDGLEQILWPDHCLQGSPGADFAPGLKMNRVEAIFRKGTDARIDSYSGFFDNGHRKDTGLGAYLKHRGVEEVFLAGLAQDVCVKFTALDAVAQGFATRLVTDGTRPVNLEPTDGRRALEELPTKGVALLTSDELKGVPA